MIAKILQGRWRVMEPYSTTAGDIPHEIQVHYGKAFHLAETVWISIHWINSGQGSMLVQTMSYNRSSQHVYLT